MIHEQDSGIRLLTFTMPKNGWDNIANQENKSEDSGVIDIDVIAVSIMLKKEESLK